MEKSKRVVKEECYYLCDDNDKIIQKNGYRYLLHKEDGPAAIFRDAHGEIIYYAYYRYNERHRIDGPATYIIHDDGSEECGYWLFGNEYDKEQFETPGFVDSIIMENS